MTFKAFIDSDTTSHDVLNNHLMCEMPQNVKKKKVSLNVIVVQLQTAMAGLIKTCMH